MDGHNQGYFFQNEATFFDFQKRAGEASPSPPLSRTPAVAEIMLQKPK